MSNRDCIVVLVVGKKRVGKTYATIQSLDKAVMGNPAKGIAPRKALIFDVNDEFSNFKFNGGQRKIKRLAIKDIELFSIHPLAEIRRIAPFWDDGRRLTTSDMHEVLSIILDNYRNGILLVEDINKYTGDNVSSDLIGSLATCRHAGLDVYAHFQQISRAGNPKLFGNANFIRYHKTNDTVSRHEKKFEEKTELLQLAENIVNYFYSVKGYTEDEKYLRTYVWVDVDESKIKPGNFPFTDVDVDNSIRKYLSDSRNRNALIKPLLNAINLDTGEKSYTEQTAIIHVMNELKKTYFEY